LSAARRLPRPLLSGPQTVQAVAAIAGGLVGVALGIPAGGLVGAMLAVALVARRVPSTPLPPWLRDGARIVAGTAAGALVSRSVLGGLGWALLWGALANLAVVGAGLLCAVLFARWSGVDRGTAFLSFAPGGLVELTALADEFDVESQVVVSVHLLRRAVTIAFVVVFIAVVAS